MPPNVNATGPSDGILSTLAAGAISGALADVATHPISTVKTRLQVQGAFVVVG